MTMPDQGADNSSRNAAMKLVEDASESGRIVQADRDMRVAQLGAGLDGTITYDSQTP